MGAGEGAGVVAGAYDRAGAVRRSGVFLGLLVVGVFLVPLLGPGLALRGTGEEAAPAVREVGWLRGVMLAALCVQAGEVWLGRLVRGAAPCPVPLPRTLAPFAALLGTLAACGLAVIVAAGNLLPRSAAAFDPGALAQSGDGRLALLEVNAFAAAWLCALGRRRALAALPLALVVLAEAVRAHPEPSTPWLGSLLTFTHLSCAALWAGGLLAVLRTVPRLPGGAGPRLLGRYARSAAYLLAALTVTGVVSTLRRMPPGTVAAQLTETAYGRVLLAKTVLVAGIAALAWRARRRLRAGRDTVAPARAELLVLAFVVLVSALLTALPLPIRW
ncbi:CopD family protein [Streptomyces sp. CA-253872]|uniref:CopD family protein n=1 Tax=Streptomyces sp. CA-253872 TaxID=3240067 RepID=UPI003D9492C4